MKRLLCLCAVVLVAPIARADDAADARKIIDKAIKAEGRTDKDALKAITFKGTGTYYGMGGEFAYSGSWATQYPDKFRVDIENVFSLILDGDKGWVVEMGTPRDMTKEELAEHKESIYSDYVTELITLKDSKFTLKTAGEGKVDDRPCVGVTVSSKGHRDITLHFDKDDGLLRKIDQSGKDAQSGSEYKQESIIKEYTTVDGVKVPKTMLILRDGKKHVDGTTTDYKFHDKLPEKTFAKPQ